MKKGKNYVMKLDEALRAYSANRNAETFYAVWQLLFEGIESNNTLSCPVEMKDETLCPLFLQGKEGEEYLVAFTWTDKERYSAVANAKLRGIVRLIFETDECEGIILNPGQDHAFLVPKQFITYAFSAACGYFAGEDDEPAESKTADGQTFAVKRPISTTVFREISERLRSLEDKAGEHLILELKEDMDEILFIQTVRSGDNLHVEIAFDMSDFDWKHPLLLGANISEDDAIELLRQLLVEGESTENIPLIMNDFRQMTVFDDEG